LFEGISTIVFDLDGTLYVNDELALEITKAASLYIGGLKGISPDEAAILIAETRERLTKKSGSDTSLTLACNELGGDTASFHRAITPEISPESFLRPDKRVVKLISSLSVKFELYIYTNNNRILSTRTLSALGIAGHFRKVFTIEDFQRPKPDRKALGDILALLGGGPENILFVGDRYDIDLRLPAELGCAVFQVTEIDDLLRLQTLTSENYIP
jgi:putative hydrolase of the HAD superfamily